eukprot:5464490-Alexandrium_andersonii.AAC.1
MSNYGTLCERPDATAYILSRVQCLILPASTLRASSLGPSLLWPQQLSGRVRGPSPRSGGSPPPRLMKSSW